MQNPDHKTDFITLLLNQIFSHINHIFNVFYMLFLKFTYFQFTQMLTYTSLSGYITNECIINPWRQLPAVCVYEQNEMPTNCGGNKIGRPSRIHDFVYKRA